VPIGYACAPPSLACLPRPAGGKGGGGLGLRVQIAGISNLEDALAVERAGAHAIGFTLGLPTGPHNGLDEHRAREIIRALPPLISSVLITYLVTAAEVVPLCQYLGTGTVQLHAPAASAEIAAMREALPGLKVIAAVNVTGVEAMKLAAVRARDADALILDTFDPATGRHGATGLTHDWAISRQIVERIAVPVILAGGLTPENVSQAIATVKPWGVDVHTGVERPDGSTDHARVRAFVAAAWAARQC
jgi:phosphoribosylanthranilate isomerase